MPRLSRIGRLLQPHLGTFFSFGAIQAAQLLLPLLALPWLARVLGPEAFGLLMYMSVMTIGVGLIMDWGFNLGATREAATYRGQDQPLARLLGAVISAKCLLMAFCLLCAVLLLPVIPYAASHPLAYGLAVLAGCSRGFNPTWFFQGTGQGMQRMALWDVCSSALVLLLTVILVRHPGHWPLYLLLTACCKGGCYALLTAGLWLRHKACWSLLAAWAALKQYKLLFGGILAGIIYSSGAQLLLGYFLPPAQMGILLTAEKIVRAAVSVSQPVTQTLFPEVCALRQQSPQQAIHILRWSLSGTLLLMLLAAGLIWLTAPWLMQLALGPGYADAPQVLRIMVLFVPIHACNYVLGTQTLVPFGQEKALITTQAVMAVFSLPLAMGLVWFWGVSGAATVSTIVEGGICLGLAWGVWHYCPLVSSKLSTPEEQA